MSVTIRGTDNSAATPAVTGTDGDTGVFFPAANTVAVATNGTEAMRVGTNQFVGFGTTNTTSSGGRVIILPADVGASGVSIALDCTNYVDANFQILVTGTAASTKKAQIGSTTNTGIDIVTGGSARIVIDSSGRVTTPSQPGFKATSTSGTVSQTTTGDTVLLSNLFNKVTTYSNFNTGSHYNTGNGRFTAPVAGKYYVFANLRWETASFVQNSYIRIFAAVNGDTNGYFAGLHQICGMNEAWTDYLPMSFSGVLDLSANDYVELRGGLNGGTGVVYASESSFGAYLIG